MITVGHKPIRRFQYTGIIGDDMYIPRMKASYERLLEDSLRDRGYLRLYDIDPAFSLVYANDQYEFTLSMHGVYVGRKVAACSVGISGGKVISLSEKSTRNIKFDQSSIPSV